MKAYAAANLLEEGLASLFEIKTIKSRTVAPRSAAYVGGMQTSSLALSKNPFLPSADFNVLSKDDIIGGTP